MKTRLKFQLDKDLILAIVVGVTGSLVALAMFFLSGYMVTQSALGAPLYALMILVVTVKLFGFLRAITRYVERLVSHKATFTMLRDIRVQFFGKLVNVIPNVYRKLSSSDLIARMISRVEALQNIYLRVYYPPIVIGLTAVVTAVVMLFISIGHAILIMFSMLLTLLIVPWLSAKKARTLKKYVTEEQSQFLNCFYDYKAGMGELKRFKRVDMYREALMRKLSQFDHLQLKEQRFLTLYDFILNIVAMISIFGSLVLGLIQINAGHLNIIYMTSIVLMILTLFEQAVPMTNVAYYKADTDQALHDINEVISTPTANGYSYLNYDMVGSDQVFDIKHASFKYWNQQSYVLQDINFKVNRGEKVAIVGPSGSGKSTLLQIMAGLYQLDNGSVLYESMNMVEINDKDKFETLNVLLQTQQLFDGTLRDNLFTEADDEIIYNIFNQLDLTHLSLEQHLDLNGSTLSGGEIQRLAIARMMLKEHSKTWILDEPSTALDQQNTTKVMDLIEAQAQTLIVATHDLNLLSRFDTIIVMINGKIVEKGNYQQLLAEQGALWNMIQYNA
ncbi:amino acid ABC transporter ATP-binding/permease protein [Staphylococcus argenteus]|uniref:amino acid ABC transporter ATP-binding/permease protein n=1 Tax=Staphylococcus argenteus TaxID=985002 RepID=UPI000507308C|nr:amino acid ABC transporter ATP-binding/permease protein [Staphylococcus argenteus]MBE2135792.1 amino acid ABC transporter ATP-binding/permease protein [Staphylococcus argenteus]MDT3004921.1 amino acid ABC transporter ATP-binding/permease protein [Staphylococcus argenteus]UPO21448.1 amino acid ABC transporter ATP-binding/permease protein [Staphylococcus argenteus]CDR62865.1 ABC transporter ATP-binding protein [Staphylococcus argenteus]HDY9493416.1 amino acid ABC transporter ATP-binding/perme